MQGLLLPFLKDDFWDNLPISNWREWFIVEKRYQSKNINGLNLLQSYIFRVVPSYWYTMIENKIIIGVYFYQLWSISDNTQLPSDMECSTRNAE